MTRRRVSKAAAPSLDRVMAQQVDMPLAKGRVAPATLAFTAEGAELILRNLEEQVVWKIDVARVAKGYVEAMPTGFSAHGSRFVRTFKDLPARPMPPMEPPTGAPALDGMAEFGLQTDDEKEYFLSKFGDLVGIVTVKRGPKGWSAGLAKSNIPRVLSADAVKNGLMPPSGHSALPKTLEAVVPAEYQYWKAQGDEARLIRDAFVDSGFFNEDTIKAVDGELRKVEVKYFLYQPQADMLAQKRDPRLPSFAERVFPIIPQHLIGKSYTPMTVREAADLDKVADDWLEALDKGDAPGALAILSPVDRSISAREMARAVKALKCEFLVEHDDTRANRAALATVGPAFKLHGQPDRVLVASFPVAGVIKLDDGPVVKTVEFQGLKIDIDRPAGFVQTGKDENGIAWERTYLFDYGFFPGTKGGDGDNLDVFIGPDDAAPSAYVVTQKKGDGSFDEYKIFVGFPSERAALDAYALHIPQRFFDGVAEVPMGALKGLLGLEPAPMTKRLGAYVRKVQGIGFETLRSMLSNALTDAFKSDTSNGNTPVSCGGVYADDILDDKVIFCKDGHQYAVGFSVNGGRVAIEGTPVEVQRLVSYQPITKGATFKRHLKVVKAGEIDLGPGHVPIAHVPKGGSSCASCKFLGDDGASCMNEYVAKYTGKPTPVPLPYPADETCSDWWDDGNIGKREVPIDKRATDARAEMAKRCVRIAVAKDSEEHYVLGIVLEPDVVDAQNDTYSADEVRQACERFMEQHRNMGLMHKGYVNDKVQILENYIAPADFQLGDQEVRKGTWMMAVRVKDDDLWSAVKGGHLTGFSIGGSAIRKPNEEGV